MVCVSLKYRIFENLDRIGIIVYVYYVNYTYIMNKILHIYVELTRFKYSLDNSY